METRKQPDSINPIHYLIDKALSDPNQQIEISLDGTTTIKTIEKTNQQTKTQIQPNEKQKSENEKTSISKFNQKKIRSILFIFLLISIISIPIGLVLQIEAIHIIGIIGSIASIISLILSLLAK